MANMEQALVTLGIIFAWMFPFLIGALAMSGMPSDDLQEDLIEEYEEKEK